LKADHSLHCCCISDTAQAHEHPCSCCSRWGDLPARSHSV